eukprot:3640071-Pleurochrysis_carterae.AAC.2
MQLATHAREHSPKCIAVSTPRISADRPEVRGARLGHPHRTRRLQTAAAHLRRGRALQLGPLAEAHDEHPGQRRGHLLRHVSGETTRRAAESGRTARRRKQWACFATASAGRIHEQAEATHQDVSGETRATERLQSEMDMAGGHTSDGNLREEKERSAACLIKYGRSRATSQGRPFGRAPRAARLSRARVRGASARRAPPHQPEQHETDASPSGRHWQQLRKFTRSRLAPRRRTARPGQRSYNKLEPSLPSTTTDDLEIEPCQCGQSSPALSATGQVVHALRYHKYPKPNVPRHSAETSASDPSTRFAPCRVAAPCHACCLQWLRRRRLPVENAALRQTRDQLLDVFLLAGFVKLTSTDNSSRRQKYGLLFSSSRHLLPVKEALFSSLREGLASSARRSIPRSSQRSSWTSSHQPSMQSGCRAAPYSIRLAAMESRISAGTAGISALIAARTVQQDCSCRRGDEIEEAFREARSVKVERSRRGRQCARRRCKRERRVATDGWDDRTARWCRREETTEKLHGHGRSIR